MSQFAPKNMTTDTAPSPYVASASSEFTSGGRLAYKAFDNVVGGITTDWLGQLVCQGHEWLMIDIGSGNEIDCASYAIAVNTQPEPTRAPKTWKLIGSNTGSKPQFAPKNMTGASAPSPYVASASSFLATFDPFHGFNGTIGASGTNWLGTGNGVDWLKIDLGSGAGVALDSYAVAVNTQPEASRAPKNWTLEGSPDDTIWTTLDTQTNQTSWGSGEIRTFVCSSPPATAFRYYRINITANNGDANYTQVCELFLYSQGWTVLDTQASQTSWTSGETRTFICATPDAVAYRYYAVNISANNGDTSFTQICELYLYTPTPITFTCAGLGSASFAGLRSVRGSFTVNGKVTAAASGNVRGAGRFQCDGKGSSSWTSFTQRRGTFTVNGRGSALWGPKTSFGSIAFTVAGVGSASWASKASLAGSFAVHGVGSVRWQAAGVMLGSFLVNGVGTAQFLVGLDGVPYTCLTKGDKPTAVVHFPNFVY